MKKTAIILGAITAALGTAVYFTFIHTFADGLTGWKKLTAKKPDADKKEEDTTTILPPDKGGVYGLKTSFPMIYREKHSKARQLQLALQNKWGKIIGGAPSDYFGQNTLTALQEIGYSAEISENDFNDIIAGKRKEGKIAIGANVYSKVTANLKSIGINTSQNIQLTEGRLVGKINKIRSEYVWINTTDGRTVGVATGNIYA